MKKKWFEVYAFSDVERGWGREGTWGYVEAFSKAEAIQKVNQPHDPFWINHGIQELAARPTLNKPRIIR